MLKLKNSKPYFSSPVKHCNLRLPPNVKLLLLFNFVGETSSTVLSSISFRTKTFCITWKYGCFNRSIIEAELSKVRLRMPNTTLFNLRWAIGSNLVPRLSLSLFLFYPLVRETERERKRELERVSMCSTSCYFLHMLRTISVTKLTILDPCFQATKH